MQLRGRKRQEKVTQVQEFPKNDKKKKKQELSPSRKLKTVEQNISGEDEKR